MHDDQLFSDVLDLAPKARADYLDRHCRDPDQRERVQQLLASHAAAKSFLETPAVARTDLTSVEDAPGTVIGPYTLRKRIGEGGCGVVHLAEQSTPVRRLVALKVIKLGMDTANVIQRFEAERQALAMMDHPDIARVFDAGSTETGRPYFVMEYVDGAPITKFADDQNLGLNDRVELFIRVCQAVQHAHQKGIIHRDLKPSNILVTLHGGIPTPKVIDFGIAKATEARLTGSTQLTALEHFIGTPAYMSPEQAEASSHDIDTRSDIYSLGVLLYELLTGRTPFDTSALIQIGIDEMRRHIREVEPPRPSTRLNTLPADTVADTASHRHLSAPSLISRLQGDLDWIVMRCLEKERGRRYDTATGLAQDLRRHLRNEPIEARPASAAYRLRKLIRRNRVAFAAGVVLLLVLMAGIVTSSIQAVRANLAEQSARTEAAIAAAVNEFLVSDILRQADGFEQANAGNTADPNLTLHEALDRAAAKVGDRFADQPLAEAAVRVAIGQSYIGLSESPAAEAQLRRAQALRDAALGPDHPASLQVRFELGRAHLGQSHFAEAITDLRAVADQQTKRFGPDHLDTCYTRTFLAQALEAAGELDEAEAIYVDLLERRTRTQGTHFAETVTAMNNLAKLIGDRGRLDEAETLYRQAVALAIEVSGPEHPDTLNMMNNLGSLLENRSKFDESLEILTGAAAALERTMGPDHHLTIAANLNRALTLKKLGRLDEAETVEEGLVEATQRAFGSEHVTTITTMNNYAATLARRNKVAEALAIREKLYETIRRVSGDDNTSTLIILANIGQNLKSLKRYPEATARMLEAIAGLERVLGPTHPTTLIIQGNLAGIYALEGNWARAAEIWRWKLDLQEAELEANHPQRVLTTTDLAKAYDALDQPARAAPLWETLLAVHRDKRGVDDAETRAVMNNLAVAYIQLGRDDDAEPLLRELLPLRQKNEADSWSTFYVESLLGGILARQTNHAAAEPLLLSGYAGMAARQDQKPARTNGLIPEAMQTLIDLYRDWAKPTEAAAWQAKREAFTPVAVE